MARYRVCLFNRFGSLFFANVFECRHCRWARWAELRRDARASRIAA
jgi:hypothetical protein